MSSQNQKKIYLFIVSIMLLCYYFLRWHNGQYLLKDSFEYIDTAKSIINGQYFHKSTSLSNAIFSSKRGILYPLFLCAFQYIPLWVALLIQSVCTLISCVLIFDLYKQLSGKRTFPLLLLLQFTPSIFIYSDLIMTECFGLFLLLLLGKLVLNRQKKFYIFWFNCALTALVLLKPVFYIFPIINLIFWSYLALKQKKRIFSPLIPVITVCAVFFLNHYKTGVSEFSSIQNSNLINYNIYLYISHNEGNEMAEKWVDSVYNVADAYITYTERNHYLASTSQSFLKKNFAGYTIFHISRAIEGCFDPGRYDLATFSKQKDANNAGIMSLLNKKNPVQIINTLYQAGQLFILLCLIPIFILTIAKNTFSIIYIFKYFKNNTVFHSIILLITCYYILISGPVNASRYMMILQGYLIIFTSICMDKYLDKKQAKKIGNPLKIKIVENSLIARISAHNLKTESVAVTIGSKIYLHNASKEQLLNSEAWLRHELQHVLQAKELGLLIFLIDYLIESYKKGYAQNKYEVEARAAELSTNNLPPIIWK